MACCFGLGACGGGGGSSSAAAPVGGTGTPPAATGDITVGKITGFGSVFVNGARYDTDGAEFYKDDDPASETDFEIGMVVKVKGDFDDDRADIVAYDEEIKGPLDENNGDSLVVLGQTVLLTMNTRIDDGLTVADLMVGDVLEVSGFRTPDDEVEASYIERKDPGDVDEYEVTGRVRDLDSSAQEFRIGGLTVNYAAAELDDISNLVDGLLVEVEDENRAYSPGDLQLFATEVEGKSPIRLDNEIDDGFDDDFDEVEIEGVVSEVIDADSFVVNGVEVEHDGNTIFFFGDATLITAGTKVQVEGTLSGEVLLARKIKFADNSARVDGLVEMVDLDARKIVVFGVTIFLNDKTELEDARDDVANFTLADVMMGDFVEVEGAIVPGGVLASEIERDDADETSLRGIATNVDATNRTLTLLGVDLVTNANTEYERDDDGDDNSGDDDLTDDDIGADAFFAALEEGQSLVEAEWDSVVTDNMVPVAELELEDED